MQTHNVSGIQYTNTLNTYTYNILYTNQVIAGNIKFIFNGDGKHNIY